MAQLYYKKVNYSPYRDRIPLQIVRAETELSAEEKAFLNAVEKGDYATVKQALQEAEIYYNVNINCMDPLGRSALLIAIENENLEIMELLLNHSVYVGDALLYAIRKEVVGAVELLLSYRRPSGEKQVPTLMMDTQFSEFTPDITPIMLAAHTNNYEIIKLLVQKRVTIPRPHQIRCNCVECVSSSEVDSLRHSRSRLNIYKALASPSLIALSSEDPILTAFRLGWELKELSKVENEFKAEYEELSQQCKLFAKDLLDQARSSRELEIILNHRDDHSEELDPQKYHDLAKLKVAIKYHQKEDHADIEWKFARTKLWMSYFDEGGTLPPPFNIIPSPKSFLYLGNWFNNTFCPKRDPDGRRRRHNLRSFTEVIRNLVKRYVAAMIRNSKTNEGLTEENFKELKQDISSFRYEVLDLLGNRKHQRRSFSTSSTELSQRDDTNDGSGGARAKSKSVSFNVGCKKKACHGPPLIRTMPRVGGAQGKSKAESSSKRSFMGPSLKKLGLLFSKFNGHMSEPSSEPMYTISDGIVQPHYMWQDIRYSQMEKGKAEACSQSEINLSEFVAQPNCQQLLATLWYDGFPGWRRKHWVVKLLTCMTIGFLFPMLSIAYLISPRSNLGLFIKKPFIKFICHTASYLTFLFMLLLASQHIVRTDLHVQGPPPTVVEWMILPWVLGFIWGEIKEMWDGGFTEYIHDWWNLMDFAMNSLYLATISLKIVAYVKYNGSRPREEWEMWHPTLIAEALFAISNILSSLRLISLFTANSHLGPLQISLGRMLLDILKFLFIYCLVLLAFANGLNQLYFYYETRAIDEPNNCKGIRCEKQNNAFSTLFETLQSLFWSVFGLLNLYVTNVKARHEFTEFVGATMFGTYNVISLVVLLNMLIAMMNNSYQLIAVSHFVLQGGG
ncbi:hypothetical protein G4228_019303 [Cervus hanglu yarkandensis]|nr:hypothetical protein G4228_019303 [Cervus hanglu yarkandensis]